MQSSVLTPRHEAAGARLRPTERGAELLTYGDVPAEYEAATRACVVFDETDRGRVRVTGGERAEFLHRLLANDVRGLAPGTGDRNLLLSPKGKVLHDFDLFVDADEIRLSVAPGREAELIRALDLYLFNEDVELAAAGEDYAPLALAGPRAAATLEAVTTARGLAGLPDRAWVAARFAAGAGEVEIAALPVAGSPGFRVSAEPETTRALWEALVGAGARPAGLVVRDILRVEAGQARTGTDVTDDVYPQEARLEPAFSLTKGCYIGQEVVAKIDTYKGLNKRLVTLRVSHDDPVPAGTRLARRDEESGEWRDLGVVTSWAYSFVLDTGLVLAYVKRKHQAPGTTFRLGEGPAEAVVVPMPVRADAVPVTGEFE